MRNPITMGIALLVVILGIVLCVFFCCKGEDNTDAGNDNSGNIGDVEGDSSDEDGTEIDFGDSLGNDLFNGDNIDPDGWTKID
jgi:hypothetical protein